MGSYRCCDINYVYFFLIIKHCRRKKYIFSIFFCKITEGLNSWVVESRNLISTKEWLNEQLLIFSNGKKNRLQLEINYAFWLKRGVTTWTKFHVPYPGAHLKPYRDRRRNTDLPPFPAHCLLAPHCPPIGWSCDSDFVLKPIFLSKNL